MSNSAVPTARLKWADFRLGFALGGYFDGILLHQILQWHHLLSIVQPISGLRAQMLPMGCSTR